MLVLRFEGQEEPLEVPLAFLPARTKAAGQPPEKPVR